MRTISHTRPTLKDGPRDYFHRVMLTPREASRRIYRHLRRRHAWEQVNARAFVEGWARGHAETPTSDGDVWEHPEALDEHCVPLEGLYEMVDEMAERRRSRKEAR